jgi:hypothetical protein
MFRRGVPIIETTFRKRLEENPAALSSNSGRPALDTASLLLPQDPL